MKKIKMKNFLIILAMLLTAKVAFSMGKITTKPQELQKLRDDRCIDQVGVCTFCNKSNSSLNSALLRISGGYNDITVSVNSVVMTLSSAYSRIKTNQRYPCCISQMVKYNQAREIVIRALTASLEGAKDTRKFIIKED